VFGLIGGAVEGYAQGFAGAFEGAGGDAGEGGEFFEFGGGEGAIGEGIFEEILGGVKCGAVGEFEGGVAGEVGAEVFPVEALGIEGEGECGGFGVVGFGWKQDAGFFIGHGVDVPDGAWDVGENCRAEEAILACAVRGGVGEGEDGAVEVSGVLGECFECWADVACAVGAVAEECRERVDDDECGVEVVGLAAEGFDGFGDFLTLQIGNFLGRGGFIHLGGVDDEDVRGVGARRGESGAEHSLSAVFVGEDDDVAGLWFGGLAVFVYVGGEEGEA